MSSQTKKTILYLITQSELGGAQCYISDLVKELQPEYNIIVAFGEQGKKGELADMLKSTKANLFTIPHLKRSISPIYDFLAIFEIYKLIKRFKPDIIHLNSSKISILGSIAGFIYNKSKIIYTAHGWVFNENLPAWKKLFYIYSEKLTSHLKDKIICVSEHDKQTARKQNIASKEKLTTVHNGIKPIDFVPREQAKQKLLSCVSAPFNISSDDNLIGCIGNLYKNKGYEYLIKSMKILIRDGIKCKLIIIGEGEERNKLEKLISELNLSTHVALAGRILSAKYLLAFDVYVNSSIKEGLSYTIIEAMQAGLPIVATHVGGTPELITNKKEGLLIRHRSPEKIAKAIKTLIEDKKLSINLGVNAKNKAIEKFNLEQMTNKTKEAYR